MDVQSKRRSLLRQDDADGGLANCLSGTKLLSPPAVTHSNTLDFVKGAHKGYKLCYVAGSPDLYGLVAGVVSCPTIPKRLGAGIPSLSGECLK